MSMNTPPPPPPQPMQPNQPPMGFQMPSGQFQMPGAVQGSAPGAMSPPGPSQGVPQPPPGTTPRPGQPGLYPEGYIKTMPLTRDMIQQIRPQIRADRRAMPDRKEFKQEWRQAKRGAIPSERIMDYVRALRGGQ